MSKKLKVLISVLVAVVLLTAGSAATVLAQEEPTPTLEKSTNGLLATRVEPQIELSESFGYVGDNMTVGLLTRVAEILGVSQEDLTNAFKQAQQEMREEALDSYLQKLVSEGKITEEEAVQYKAWWQARPDMSQYQQQIREWEQARPDMPLPGRFERFGSRGFHGGMRGSGGCSFWGR